MFNYSYVKILISSVLIVLVTVINSSAEIQWTKYPNNPIFSAPTEIDDEMVLKDGDVYRMWYQSENDHNIYYATSDDGINWNGYVGNPVLLRGPFGSWDAVEVDGPSVIIEGGLFKMWFSSEGMNGNIGYATSIDGITWEKYNGNPVIEDGELPSVIYDNGIYKMWYWSSGGIFYATSMDGIDWNKHSSNPVVQGDVTFALAITFGLNTFVASVGVRIGPRRIAM